MKLSTLQKHILRESYGQAGKILRSRFDKFYSTQKTAPAKDEQIKIISRSIDRLINKGLLVGYGEKTRYKWFIREIKLTSAGRRSAKKLQGEQTKFIFKK
ncbi:MAG: hypothetical protein NTZ18_02725 [Candidatus Komeilibacteria bacterium]|nr:hypothetical protein [Candidatus Komeilibacteria bacterium]